MNRSSADSNMFTIGDAAPPALDPLEIVIPAVVSPESPFTLQVTIRNNGGQGDHGGISISFPDLAEQDSSMPPYESSLADVAIDPASTFSTVNFFDQGDTIYDSTGAPIAAQHLLVEGDENAWNYDDSQTLALVVTPHVTGPLAIRVRAWIADAGTGYGPPIHRSPEGGESGIVPDQQSLWSYEFSVNVSDNILQIDDGLVHDDMWGNYQFDAVEITNGSTLQVMSRYYDDLAGEWKGGWLQLVTGPLVIEEGSHLKADAAGYADVQDKPLEDDQKTGGDSDSLTQNRPGGGGYGGGGGRVFNGANAGLIDGECAAIDYEGGTSQLMMGGRGGRIHQTIPVLITPQHQEFIDIYANGGTGGGAISIIAQDVIVRDSSTISANGGNGILALSEVLAEILANEFGLSQQQIDSILEGLGYDFGAGSGAGAGGQIVIDARTVTIENGSEITANGGNTSISGAGGGGRILIAVAESFLNSGTIEAKGGSASDDTAGYGHDAFVCTPGTSCFPGNPVSSSPTDLSLLIDDDTGVSNSDNLTNIATPRVFVTAPADSEIRLYEGQNLIGVGDTDSSGQGVVQVSPPLADGTHTITATARQVCHDESEPSSVSATITIDTRSPAISVPDLQQFSDLGHWANDDITSDASPTFEGTCEIGADVELVEGMTVLGSYVSPDGTWVITSLALAEGNHAIAAKAVDAAGNEATSNALQVVIDLTPPSIMGVTVLPTGCQIPGQAFSIQASIVDGLSGMTDAWNPEAAIKLDNVIIDDFNLLPTGGSTYEALWDSSGQVAGDYDVSVVAWDLAGNSTSAQDAASACVEFAKGDMDCNGVVEVFDVPLFVEALIVPGTFTGCDITRADIDGDGFRNGLDVQSFVNLLTPP